MNAVKENICVSNDSNLSLLIRLYNCFSLIEKSQRVNRKQFLIFINKFLFLFGGKIK